MTSSSLRVVESKIRRLDREIAEIQDYMYGPSKDKDRRLYASMLEHKRNDVVRSCVLQIHTAIENLIDHLIICRVLDVGIERGVRKPRSNAARALEAMLDGAGSLGFEMKLNFAVALGLITMRTRVKLAELNTLRNRCSHNWLLNVPVRRKRRPRQKKPPLLAFRGRDLHKVPVLKDFLAEYGMLYVRLFGYLLKFAD